MPVESCDSESRSATLWWACEWSLEPPCWRQVVHRAIEHGINYLDTAPLYGIGECERLTGLALSGGLREKVLPLGVRCPGQF